MIYSGSILKHILSNNLIKSIEMECIGLALVEAPDFIFQKVWYVVSLKGFYHAFACFRQPFGFCFV
jgi:hypothetical protein